MYTEESKKEFLEEFLNTGSVALTIEKLKYPSEATAIKWTKELRVEINNIHYNLPDNINDIVEDLGKKTVEDVAKEYNLDIDYVRKLRIASYAFLNIVKKRQNFTVKKCNYTKEQKELALRVYKETGDLYKTIEQLGYPSRNTLLRWAGVQRYSCGWRYVNLISDFKNGISKDRLCEKYNLTMSTVIRWILASNISIEEVYTEEEKKNIVLGIYFTKTKVKPSNKDYGGLTEHIVEKWYEKYKSDLLKEGYSITTKSSCRRLTTDKKMQIIKEVYDDRVLSRSEASKLYEVSETSISNWNKSLRGNAERQRLSVKEKQQAVVDIFIRRTISIEEFAKSKGLLCNTIYSWKNLYYEELYDTHKEEEYVDTTLDEKYKAIVDAYCKHTRTIDSVLEEYKICRSTFYNWKESFRERLIEDGYGCNILRNFQ